MDVTLTPDQIIYWQWGPLSLNATIVFTWVVMAILTAGSWLITRNLTAGPDPSRWQNLLESVVLAIREEIREIAGHDPDRYLPFVGTLFLFISVANFLFIVPGYRAPTESLSTTAALAICTFFAVPFFGIWQRGLLGYFRRYVEPTPIMLPFHLLSEFSRTLALAVRLFGSMLSGSLIVAILIGIVPLFVPVALELLGLIIGQIQAYIFAVLAMVYIASAAQAHQQHEEQAQALQNTGEENERL